MGRRMKAILEEFRAKRATYASLGATCEDLLARLLSNSGLQIHEITHRVKSLPSLSGKIGRSDNKYTELGEITDLVGLRITTYFEDDVDQIAKLIESQFVVDKVNSVDKRMALDSDRFGYQSLHYVVSLSPERIQLDEYRRCQGLKIEIQIRSILQHAWAEIEHDLGYKAAGEVPRGIKRRFARVAGLLEVADSEFTGLRRELKSYEESVSGRIKSAPDTVGIDLASLASAYDQVAVFADLDAAIASTAAAVVKKDDREFISRAVARLQFFEIESIEALTDLVVDHFENIKVFAERWFDGSTHKYLYQGIGIFYLAYWLAASTGDVNFVNAYLSKSNIGNEGDRKEMAERAVQMCQLIRDMV